MGLREIYLLLLASAVFATEKPYVEFKIYDIKPNTVEEQRVLRNLEELDGEKRSLDFLSFHNNLNDVVKLMVKPEEQEYVEEFLSLNNIDWRVTVKNIQE